MGIYPSSYLDAHNQDNSVRDDSVSLVEARKEGIPNVGVRGFDNIFLISIEDIIGDSVASDTAPGKEDIFSILIYG